MKSLESKIDAQPMLWGDIYCKLEGNDIYKKIADDDYAKIV